MSFTTVKLGLNFWGALFKQQYCILRASKETRFKKHSPSTPIWSKLFDVCFDHNANHFCNASPRERRKLTFVIMRTIKVKWKSKKRKISKTTKKRNRNFTHRHTRDKWSKSSSPHHATSVWKIRMNKTSSHFPFWLFRQILRTEILRQKLFRKIWIWENWEIWTKRLWNTNYLFVSFVAKLKLSFAQKRNYFLCFRHWVIS